MLKTYDRETAERLIPLLDSICVEIEERRAAILSAELEQRRPSSVASEEAGADLAALLSNHRREVRAARAEITRLGCLLETGGTCSVLIPGDDRSPSWRWIKGEQRLRTLRPSLREAS